MFHVNRSVNVEQLKNAIIVGSSHLKQGVWNVTGHKLCVTNDPIMPTHIICPKEVRKHDDDIKKKPWKWLNMLLILW